MLPAPAQVYLDGKLLKPGQPDLSGEVLTIVADPSAQIELIVEPLLGEDTLYQRYLHHTDVIENGVLYQHWGSAGLIQNYKYAVYYGHQTQGKMLLDGGRFLIATPVLRIPSANDPLIGRNTQTLQAGLNSYQVTSLDVTPYKNIEIDGIPVQQYQPRPFVIPENIVDPNDTPQTNPFLFPGYLYLDSLQPLDGDEQMAVFDLPLNSRIYVVVNGQEVWWGQTRLLPMLVSPRRIQRSFSSMEELADLSYWIWRASMEALSLWKCALPSSVNVTMEEFVLSRVAYGWPREDGSQGSIRVQVGDTSFSGTSDHSLKRRLANLAEMLRACQDDPGLFPEDEFGAEWVSPHKYGDPYDARLPYLRDPAGAFSAASYTTLRQMLDPFEMRRPPRV
ncbi:MAG: hypothetical protein D6800_03245 [Candidatus Zixiibacteriota bacterium]|nr:MAG: hypothetical protein D6800_03245 [candidate division Zixibacteria bacterium]